MLVNNKSGRVVSIGTNRLVPGVNEVDKGEWDKVQKTLAANPNIAQDLVVAKETVKDANGKPTKSEPIEFSELAPEKAAAIVSETLAESTLDAWLETETRESVRKAIYAQKELLKDPDNLKRVKEKATKKKG